MKTPTKESCPTGPEKKPGAGKKSDKTTRIFHLPGTDWIAPKDRETVKKNISDGYTRPYEVQALRKDGTTFPAQIQGSVIDDGEEQLRVTALRDISQLKQALNSLEKEKYKILMDNANDAIYIAQDRLIKFANPKTFELYGYPKKNHMGPIQCRPDYLGGKNCCPGLHKGYFQVLSEKHEGTRFELYFPASRDMPKQILTIFSLIHFKETMKPFWWLMTIKGREKSHKNALKCLDTYPLQWAAEKALYRSKTCYCPEKRTEF